MRNLGDLNKWTKAELAQVTLQAMYNAADPFPSDHPKVLAMVKKRSKAELVDRCELALQAIGRRQ